MINAAVVGLGRWGKSIVEAVQGRSGRIRVVHGVSKEPETVRDFAARQGFRLSTAFEDAIADPLVEAVFLATPHSVHVGQVVAAAEAGKHVWCEKPLALTRQEARRAVEACRRAGVVLATGFNKRCFVRCGSSSAWSTAVRLATSCMWRAITATSTAPEFPEGGAMIQTSRRAPA
jgi:predicted dehydrogenase